MKFFQRAAANAEPMAAGAVPSADTSGLVAALACQALVLIREAAEVRGASGADCGWP